MSNPKDYTVGWICAITTEYVAAQAFLDEKHEGPEYLSPHNKNDYTLGKIGKHNVVIAVLPMGEYGTSSAARVAEDMLHSFPNIRIGLMVGIGGGAPSPKHDIRLGDIVVSIPGNGQGGVFQYDFGKTIQGQSFQSTRFLNQPPTILCAAVNGLQAQYESEGHQLEEAINDALVKKPRLRKKYKRPDQASDQLYRSQVIHPPDSESSCATDPSYFIPRSERTDDEDNPMIHYGLIASANQLMKDALIRDKLAAEKDVLCFEMEAAGLMNHFPCLVIRGICDYADSHKNKDWQGYAAMAAAAYTKDLLYRIVPQHVEAEKKITDILSTVNEIHKTTQDTNTAVKKISQHSEDQECQTILDWLTSTTYASEQSDFIGRRQDGTGEYLVKSNEFKNWVSQKKQIMFCPGIPGAGKTIATCIVVDYISRRFQNDASVGIAYLYCNFRRQEEQHPINLLMSLLRQLARPSVPETVRNLHKKHTAKETRPSFDEILDVLNSVIAGYSRAFIIIDALDECKLSDEVRSKFMSAIFNVQAKTSANLFATSRFIPDIEREFQKIGAVSLEIRASDEDVGKYLDGHQSRLPSFVQECPDLRNQVKTAIIEAAKGMFLLAILNLDSLEDKINRAQMEHALRTLPKGLGAYNEAYQEAMERIRGQKQGFQDLAIQTLSWITCAKSPLTTLELQYALAVTDNASALDERNITETGLIASVCAGLVTIDEESDIIRLVHYTAQEYLERTWKDWFPNAHSDITKACVTYLSFKVFDTGYSPTKYALVERLESNPLYRYAAQSWGYHAGKAFMEEEKLILDFLQSTAKVSACSQAMLYYYYRRSSETKMTGVHLAACFGLANSISALLERFHDINSEDYSGRIPLSWAAEKGHAAVVKLLVDNGADLESKDQDSQTPLSWAAKKGHEAVVKLLLDMNTDIETKDLSGRTPLLLAALYGHAAVVKLLLDNNADVETKDLLTGQTPLLLATKYGHAAVVKLLIDQNANIKTKDSFGRTLLIWAAVNGHNAVVKLLVDKGADLKSKDNKYGRTPLIWAAEKGHEAVMKLLVDKGADLESKDQHGRTSLSWAAEKGHEAVVKLLVDKGADLESKDNKYGRTPLSRATEKGHEAVVKLLIDKGADLESKDNKYSWTPLIWAALNGHEAVVKLLVDKGADLESKDNKYSWTPLIWAALNGHEAVVKLLVDKGADLESKDQYSQTPLSWAAEKGHEAVVKLLVDKGADLESKDQYSQTPLSWAAEKGHEAVVKLLVDKGADLESKDQCSQTPLSWAAEKGHAAVVKLLVDKGADLESKDNKYGRTPLSWATEKGHEAVVKLLIDKGADLESKDNKYSWTPLIWAALNGHEAVVKLLVDMGTDLESKDQHGRTSLSWAAEMGHKAVVKLLVDKGADLESKDQDGRTPLSWAAAKKLNGQGMQTLGGQPNHALHGDQMLLEHPPTSDLEGCTSYPEGWTSYPEGWTSDPEGSTSDLEGSTSDPEGWTSYPKDSTSDPEGSTSNLKDWTSESYPSQLQLLDMRRSMMTQHEQYIMARTDAQLAVVKLLVAKGADRESKDHHGRTPLSWAAENMRRW